MKALIQQSLGQETSSASASSLLGTAGHLWPAQGGFCSRWAHTRTHEFGRGPSDGLQATEKLLTTSDNFGPQTATRVSAAMALAYLATCCTKNMVIHNHFVLSHDATGKKMMRQMQCVQSLVLILVLSGCTSGQSSIVTVPHGCTH